MTAVERSELRKNERPADRKVERSKAIFNRSLKYFLVLAGCMLIMVVGYLFIRAQTKTDTCHAIITNNKIFQKYVEHAYRKSNASIKAGITNGITSIKQNKEFYEPTLNEIVSVRCG